LRLSISIRGGLIISKNPNDFSFKKRWHHQELFDNGYVPIPNNFLTDYAELNISTNEAMFIIHLMSFKWDLRNPFPGYGILAKRMGVTDKMARRYAQSLQKKGYLLRTPVPGRTNMFDLSPLFTALLKRLEEKDRGSGTSE
jgi:hypothetical protein